MQDPKIGHLGTIAQLYWAISSQLRHESTIGKSVLNSNISSRCPHNIANFGPLAAEIGSGIWGTPANLNGSRFLASFTAATSLNGSQPNFARCLTVSWAGTLYIHFRGLLPLTEFCQVQYSLCVQVLRSHNILAALLHGTRAVGVSQTLRRSNEPIIKSEKSIFLCTVFLAVSSCPSIRPYDVILASLGRI